MTRDYTSSDYPTILEWAQEKCVPAPPVSMLPQLGIVSETGGAIDAAAWLYVDAHAKVGFPHWLITRPGLRLSESRVIVGDVLGTIIERAKSSGIHTLITHTHDEGVTREAVNLFGWQIIGFGATLYQQLI